MKKQYIALVLFALFAYSLSAQPVRKQAVGLCLSGGGARGLAHIALLKAIDSLGVQVDYITGTSMGAIMGGLYAIGYSGKQLDSIARTTDWARLFETKTPFDEVAPDEQDEFGRYVLEMPMRNNKFELPSGMIEGQTLLNMLERMTAHVAHIQDFNQLPIPFRCMAANISDGQPVVIDHGNLAMAMRTSMSIPGVFAPVSMGGNKILVDGGVFKNFPVDVLCDMGADMVIGGYTSISIIPEGELHSMTKIVAQSANFSRLTDSDNQRMSCSIFADYAQALNAAKLSAGDFRKAKDILAVGDAVVAPLIPELKRLAEEQQMAYSEIPAGTVKLKRPAPFHSKPLPPLQIYSNNNARLVFKAGLHYDSEMDAGLIGNFTFRNLLGERSRTLLSTEISENYKIRAEHRMGIRNSHNYFVTRTYYERVVTPVALYESPNEVFRRRYFRFQTGIQRTIGRRTLMGTFLTWEQVGYKPDTRISRRLQPLPENDTITGVIKLSAQMPALEFILLRQSLDNPVFPTSGGRFSVQARFSVATRTRLRFETVNDGRIIETEDIINLVQPYTKVLLRWERVYPMSEYVSFYPRLMGGARLTNAQQEAELYVLDRFNVGGTDWRNDWAFVPFAGNREGYALFSAFATAQLSFPVHFQKKYFVIPQYNILSGADALQLQSTPVLNIGQTIQQSVALTVGMQTILGPVWINVAKADNDKSLRLYSSIGLRF